MHVRTIFVSFLLILVIVACVEGKKKDGKDKPEWAKKDIRDYSDADLERLLEQWEEDEEPLPEDELPEHLRQPKAMDFSGVDMTNPENILKLSKKGKTVMTFVTVSGKPTREETEELTKLWQSALWNSHIQAERFLVDDNRAIFMFKDGSQAWDAKDFLIDQERCAEVTIENKSYPGKMVEKGAKKSKTKDKQEL